MMESTWIKAASRAGVILIALALAGCTYPGDTSGFKAETKPTKAEIQQQIEDLKANSKVPEGIKQTAMKKLEKDLETAQ
ncbi:MAG TPA: hypothetical protein VKU00_08760 [Chthonomonadaceae bacterium]|nr:hypothetical protein [Chthonomonadaceae bacterium]